LKRVWSEWKSSSFCDFPARFGVIHLIMRQKCASVHTGTLAVAAFSRTTRSVAGWGSDSHRHRNLDVKTLLCNHIDFSLSNELHQTLGFLEAYTE
jgi:hypothetical protein